MEGNVCVVCSSSDLQYDEEHGRFVCQICNTMQEFSGIGVTTYDNSPMVNFQRLKTYSLKKTIKLTSDEKEQLKTAKSEPWDLKGVFKWIFEKQVASMEPYVVDWDHFNKLSKAIWEKYMTATGAKFDIISESNDNVRMQKFPIGWGSTYDPKKGPNLLAQANIEFKKLQRENFGDSADEVDYDKVQRNADKIRIERMIHMKRLDKASKRSRIDEGLAGNDNDKTESESSSEESAVADEDDPSYVQLDFMDDKEKAKVRILRKKKMQDVMWNGSFYANASRYMENNIVMLFLTLYFSRSKRDDCCCLMDVLRLVRAKVVPYIRIKRFLPAYRYYVNDRSYHAYFRRNQAPCWTFLLCCFSRIVSSMNLGYLIRVDIDGLIHRIVRDLNLPRGLCSLLDFLRNKLKPKCKSRLKVDRQSNLIRANPRFLSSRYPYTLMPEPFCVANIFVTLRALLKIDGDYEVKVSHAAQRLQASGAVASARRLFIWTDWWSEMFQRPGLSQCHNWDDLYKVADSGPFLENDDEIGDNDEHFLNLGMEYNEDVNHQGRSTNVRNHGKLQENLDNVERPLREVFDSVKQMLPKKREPEDFTDTDIQYLVSPAEFRTTINGQDEILDELTRLVADHNLALHRISIPPLLEDFDDDVLHSRFTTNTTPLEDDLLRILTHNTGFSPKEVFRYITEIETQLADDVGGGAVRRRKCRVKKRQTLSQKSECTVP